MNTTSRSLRTVLAVSLLAATVSLAACSDDLDSSGATSETTEDNQLPAPVIVDVTTLDGTTVSVPASNVVIVDVDDPTAWTATVEDESIATFTPGSDDGSASFNPGFAPQSAGTTTVTMTDGTTTVTFTLDVTA